MRIAISMFDKVKAGYGHKRPLVLSMATLLSLVGCGPTSIAPSETASAGGSMPQVVVTTSVLCDLMQQIAQDTIGLTCLMDPGQDPHTYAATPSDRKAIDGADLILYGGYGVAADLAKMVESSNNTAPKIAVYEAAVPTPLMAAAHDGHHGDEHDAHGDEHDAHGDEHDDEHDAHDDEHDAHGDEHDAHDSGAGHDGDAMAADPHIWHNALHNGQIVAVIATHLQQVNPDQAEDYRQVADQLSSQFTDLHRWIETQVDTIPADNRQLVTTHAAFNYFADAYGFEVEGALSGVSTEESPAASRLAELVDTVKATGVPAIFAESTTSPKLMEALAKDAQVAVADQALWVEGPGGVGTAAETVQAMLVENTCTVVNALGGSCTKSEAPI